jgi:H+/Cl- antiporter ClcA
MACCAAAAFILLNIGYAVRKYLFPFFRPPEEVNRYNAAVMWSPRPLSMPAAAAADGADVASGFAGFRRLAARAPIRTAVALALTCFMIGLGAGLINDRQTGGATFSEATLRELAQTSVCKRWFGGFSSLALDSPRSE